METQWIPALPSRHIASLDFPWQGSRVRLLRRGGWARSPPPGVQFEADVSKTPDNSLTGPQVVTLARYFGRHYGASDVQPPAAVEERRVATVDWDLVLHKETHRE